MDLRELPAKPAVNPENALPTLHSDWLFEEGGYDVIGTGFTPPVTGLAQGRDLVYIGISGPRVENGRLVVKAESEINTVEDLRGKRVGIAHGSWQTTLLLFALDQAGLTWSDIVPVDTDVRGGGADLVDGTIDAWVGAYPGLTDIEANHELRTLIATDGLFSHPSLWVHPARFRGDQSGGPSGDHRGSAGIRCVDRSQSPRSRADLRRRRREAWWVRKPRCLGSCTARTSFRRQPGHRRVPRRAAAGGRSPAEQRTTAEGGHRPRSSRAVDQRVRRFGSFVDLMTHS